MRNIHKVNEKFRQFMTIIRQNSINKCDALKKLREIYDEILIVECELLIYAIDKIVDAANCKYYS